MSQRILGPSGTKRRRMRLGLLVALAASVFAVFFVSGASGLLSGSSFETFNGSLTGSPHDWNNPIEPISCPSTIPGTGPNCGLDLVKDGADNSLGQGSKEDDLSVTVVDGSIPPSKDDLSRFYVNHEKAASDFLYVAWERSNLLGSAHMDFELNQNQVGIGTTPGPVTLNRTVGDLLIDFDFGGSGVPVLAVHRWIDAPSSPSLCEASNSVPCWDKGTPLSAVSAESSVNNADVTDNNPPGNPRTLSGNTKNGINSTFGEAGINLTAAGIFPPNVCRHFGDIWLKSRSSGNSFGSELKDFVAPIPINISNCGTIKIRKQTDPDGATGTFSFTHDVDGKSTPTVPSPFTLSDNGEQDFTNVLAGTYHFTEAATPGFDFINITCTVTGSGGSTHTESGPNLTIVLKVDDTVDCTYNNRQRGKIVIKKVTVPSPDPTGTTFSFTPAGSIGTTGFGLKDGQSNTYTDVVPGSANSVNETVPVGWELTSATCDNGNDPKVNITVVAGGTTTCTFTNTLKLGALKITKKSSKSGNASLSGAVFSVTDPDGNPVSGSPFTVNGSLCLDGLSKLGNYVVKEVSPPAGYTIDPPDTQTISVVGNNAKCSDAVFAGTLFAFTDTPKTDLDIKVSSQDSGPGGSNSTITCTNDVGVPKPNIGNSPQGPGNSVEVQALGLAPGDYTCAVHIDP